MRHRIADLPVDAERLLAEVEDDNSGVGVNYADAFLKALKTTLDDGRKVVAKRRGLKVTLAVGERRGEGLLRRLEHGPEVQEILRQALVEAASDAGLGFAIDGGTLFIDAK